MAQRTQLLRVAWFIAGDRDLAEDLLQEALIKLASRWDGVRSDPAAYVRKTIYHDMVSWRRRKVTLGNRHA